MKVSFMWTEKRKFNYLTLGLLAIAIVLWILNSTLPV